MAGSDLPAGLPDPASLRPRVLEYFHSALGGVASDIDELRDAVCNVFCRFADAGVAVEKALAAVNAEVDRIARSVPESNPALQTLKRIVMTCCLDCYYPHAPDGNSERVSA